MKWLVALLVITAVLIAANNVDAADCFDKNPNCQYWALRGDCTKNPKFMMATCCMWCDKVKNLERVLYFYCKDRNYNCIAWANREECCKNPAYMLDFCCSACRTKGWTIHTFGIKKE